MSAGASDALTPLEKAKTYAQEVRREMVGREREALIGAGVDEAFLRNKNGPCPGCGGVDRFRFDDKGRGSWICSQGGGGTIAGDVFELLRHIYGGSFGDAVKRIGDVYGVHHPDDDRSSPKIRPKVVARAAPVRVVEEEAPRYTTLSEFGRQLWGACDKLQGIATAYLQARNCVIPPADGDLRFHPELRHPISGYVGPALVGLITDFVTGEPLSLHRTWIQSDGRKAQVDPPRMYLGRHRKQGGVVRLWPDDAVTQGLALSEGIETALSVAHGMTPVWATIDAGNLAALAVLPGITALTIAADQDKAGLTAARECGGRWHHAGREVRVVVAPPGLNDLNDLAVAA